MTGEVAEPVPSVADERRRRGFSAFVVQLVHETWKYFLVSVVALGVDFGLLVLCTRFAGLHYLISAAIGFSAGILVSYGLSVSWVFRHRRLASRRFEFVAFFGIGLLGLALNEALMRAFVEGAGLNYAIAKIPAAGIGFVFNFGSRRILLFSRGNGTPPAPQ
ncbi:MAG: GtrA family protein [Caulobacterales bacterium]